MSEPTLTEFLLARIAEDEALALAAVEDDGGEDGGLEDAYEELIRPPSGVGSASGGFGEALARLMVHSTPRRMLAECEAKRRIVEIVAQLGGHYEPTANRLAPGILRALALPYADHAEFREQRRP